MEIMYGQLWILLAHMDSVFYQWREGSFYWMSVFLQRESEHQTLKPFEITFYQHVDIIKSPVHSLLLVKSIPKIKFEDSSPASLREVIT